MAHLKTLTGEDEGKQFDIEQDQVSLGRAPDNTLPIASSAASSYHCLLLRDGNKYTLKDLKSTNGTRVNGQNIGEERLRSGDTIEVGGVEILFEGANVADSAGRPPPPQKTVPLDADFQSAIQAQEAGERAPSFSTRKSGRRAWVIGIVLVGSMALLALALFFFRLLTA